MFSLRLTARPDARMVEVPLEIEAELPREFEGAAVLASSGLPRRVRLRAAKDALKISTAYRADQLVGDIVRSALRGTTADVHRVQEAVMRFVRAVRDRRQDGATLLVSSNGRGKIEVVESMGSARSQPPPGPVQPFEAPPQSRPPPAADRFSLVEKRVADLEAAITRLRAGGDLVERIGQLEQKLAPAMAQISRTLGDAGIAGPGLENHSVQSAARNPASPRRATAVDAYAEGLRGELRTRAAGAAERARAEVERCDRAAALAVDAELLGAPADGTAHRLREASGQVAARQTALTRLAEEIEFYGGPELPIASQLLARLEEPIARDPAPALELVAQALVRAARDDDGGLRTAWLQRAAALCGWHLVSPAPGDPVQPEWHQPVDSGGEVVVALACPGLKRLDGTPIVEARVKVDPGPSKVEVAPPAAPAVIPAPSSAVEALATALAAAPDPAPALPVSTPIASALPDPSPVPFALLPAPSATPMVAFAELVGDSAILPTEAATAALSAAHALRIVAGDPAMNDEALATQLALSLNRSPDSDRVQPDLVDARTDEIHGLLDPLAHLKPRG